MLTNLLYKCNVSIEKIPLKCNDYHTQTNTLRSHKRSDIQETHSTISTNFSLQHIAFHPAQQFLFGIIRNVTKEKKVEVIEVEDDIDTEEVSDLPYKKIIAGYFFVVSQELEAFVEIYNDDELSDSEIASLMELIPRTKLFERILATPPDVLYCQINNKYYTQNEIAEYLKNSDHNYDWIINELINELHAFYIRVCNLDNNKAMLQDFELGINSYNKSLRKLSTIQIANMMSVEDIRKIWK
ncbi:hypothetical protein RhiirA4_462731 [Rhizophagus irregularis]|uniref:Uncharacterized protein n=1 Tax=Rhizophagus irregularis TaxID=588596 RepID=A0A2I1GLM8_9GLOM|nr:hypothetical protein RhiirA4_462731 [Rhizophagus irregularis]